MTTILTRPLDATARPGKVTLLRVLRSEWIKLRTVRSTSVTLLIAVAAMVGLGMLVTHLRAGDLNARELAHFNGAELSLSMFRPAQLAVGVLGVLMFTGEYSTGLIRATLTAVPRRLPMLAAKAAVFTGVVLVLMTAASFAAFFGGQAVLSSAHPHLAMNLSDPGSPVWSSVPASTSPSSDCSASPWAPSSAALREPSPHWWASCSSCPDWEPCFRPTGLSTSTPTCPAMPDEPCSRSSPIPRWPPGQVCHCSPDT